MKKSLLLLSALPALLSISCGKNQETKPKGNGHTIESVAQDVLEAVFYGETNYNQGIAYIDDEAFMERVSEETTLLAAATDGANRISRVEYLEILEDYGVFEDYWDNGDVGAFAYFSDEDYWNNGIMVEVGAYQEGEAIFVQYCVYAVDPYEE